MQKVLLRRIDRYNVSVNKGKQENFAKNYNENEFYAPNFSEEILHKTERNASRREYQGMDNK